MRKGSLVSNHWMISKTNVTSNNKRYNDIRYRSGGMQANDYNWNTTNSVNRPYRDGDNNFDRNHGQRNNTGRSNNRENSNNNIEQLGFSDREV